MALAGLMAVALAASTPACPADPELVYVCGPEKPEDLLAIPDTPWLVSSGFADGAGLKLVDTRDRSYRRWYDGGAAQVAFDGAAWPGCPGPVDPALFNARGLSLQRTGADRWRLLAVNHGGRQSIEVFDLATGNGPPQVTWRGCVPMPAGQVGNAVAAFADGTILVTVLTRPGTTIADFMLGRATGGVWRRRPGEAGFTLLPGTELPGDNGLEVDPDQRRFYVVAFGWHAVVTFDRADTRVPLARVVALDFMPDNIHWTGGRLLLAGMRLDDPTCGGLRRVEGGVADAMLCHRGWVVGELRSAEGRIATVAYGTPQPGFNGLSAAAVVGTELWLGSFQSSRLAIVRDWNGTTP